MAPKTSKGKGVASSRHGCKGSKRANEEQNEDISLPQKSLRHFGLRWVMEQEVKKWFNTKNQTVEDEWSDSRAVVAAQHYPLSKHSRALYRVGGPGFDEPLVDDDSTDKEQARVDFDLKYDDEEDDSEIGEVALAPINDED
ncbi:hypothetical protein HAX54_042683 [Datura stramonium]|uniref:Uncharacterized protein n=1 Tax=Datura stramonium TaxID=4076 RepID=A0ABS8W295_DATST|nr:hypothetical protein [Datura stramonium]